MKSASVVTTTVETHMKLGLTVMVEDPLLCTAWHFSLLVGSALSDFTAYINLTWTLSAWAALICLIWTNPGLVLTFLSKQLHHFRQHCAHHVSWIAIDSASVWWGRTNMITDHPKWGTSLMKRLNAELHYMKQIRDMASPCRCNYALQWCQCM